MVVAYVILIIMFVFACIGAKNTIDKIFRKRDGLHVRSDRNSEKDV